MINFNNFSSILIIWKTGHCGSLGCGPAVPLPSNENKTLFLKRCQRERGKQREQESKVVH